MQNLNNSFSGQPMDIAIIGMGAIFPASNGNKAYWRLIFNGKDAITPIPEESHWSLADYFDSNPATPDYTYCKRGGFLPKINFDPAKYGFPPNNLEATDTSQLLALMVAEMALVDAGYPPSNSSSSNHLRTGVILGVTGTQELVIPLGARLYHPLWKKALYESGITGKKSDEIVARISEGLPKWQENSFPGLLGNVVAGRIANRLNLGGTNTVVDAACASSLSAIHTACLELAAHRSDMCISGGVDTLNDIFMHMCFSKTGVLSHTSDARPFSKDADGTVLGEGIGMVVLKRLTDAKKDNDKIYAVIKGIGTSSDGKTGGIYAPDANGQLRALKAAYKEAQIDPSTVELIEAHGTGTRVGDKIEITALKSLFSEKNSKSAIGSVKSMVGHAKAAAGAAGLIKAVLSLYHKVIPPTLKAEEPDPEIEITKSPFYLNHLAKPWVKSKDHPRRCGVSAFGFGGSNFHALLEEYLPKKEHVSWDGTVQIAPFCANTKEDLKKSILKFKGSIEPSALLKNGEGLDSYEMEHKIAWESQNLRKEFKSSYKHRLLILITDRDDPVKKALNAIDYIDSLNNHNKITKSDKSDKEFSGIFYGSGEHKGKIGFLFPGQGSQYVDMARDLISIFPEALEALEEAEEIFNRVNDKKVKLKDYIFSQPPYAQDEKSAEENLRNTDVAQPAIGAITLGMVKILARFGIKPDAVCGHSFGELSALCAANWIDENTFLNLASQRGRLMAGAALNGEDRGSMFALKASLEDVEELIKAENLDLVVANINSPNQIVLSGKSDEIKRVSKICKDRKVRGVQLPVAAAFHSKLVENAVAPFKEIVSSIEIKPSNGSNIVVFSNTTGKDYPLDGEAAKKILGEHLINPVCFMSNIEVMLKKNITAFIEVGPKAVLTGLTKSILESKNIEGSNKILSFAFDSSAGKNGAIYDLASTLCSLAACGITVMLDQWEDSVKEPAKKMMRVALTGANIKPKPQKVLVSDPSTNLQSPTNLQSDNQPNLKPKLEAHIIEPKKIYSPNKKEEKGRGTTMNNKGDILQPPSLVFSAMQMVQKGMDSMQELQTRTALAHEKFLETQAAASQTLQAMMEQTRFFAENAILSLNHNNQNIHHYQQPTTISRVSTNHEIPNQMRVGTSPTVVELHHTHNVEQLRIEEPPQARIQPEHIVEHSKNNGKNASNPVTNTFIPKNHANRTEAKIDVLPKETTQIAKQKELINNENNNQNNKVMAILLETISELTGFPVEMLTPDMDIESDLGIDSIKRVEILSKLEEKLPEADQISPDDLGRLKTIDEIAVHLMGNNSEKSGQLLVSSTKEPSLCESGSCQKKNF
ncbi:MAG: acyltransferase domain-containing protein [Desulfamplus sp.]|nr:acyltransferase domain-containing protein [Desulfamplus sp.]